MLRTNTEIDLLGQLATGVAMLDADLRVAYANPAFAERSGFAASRLLGNTLATMGPDGERLHASALRARSDADALTLRDARVSAAPGHEARLDVTFTPVATGVLVEVHPATPEASTTRVSESLRGFAHEVRNPLAAISGAAQLLEQGAGDARQRQLAQLIRDESARLAALAERLLGARGAMATRAVNVHAPLERAAELLKAEHADIAIVRDYDPSLPAWHGDPDRLLQAVLNLVRNAVEAHAQRVVLRSRAEAGWRDARGQRVPALRIEVEDDGNGVPDAIAASLFEPMVSGRPDGTGLGLALAREIAREHGGELTYQPREAGSRFVLRLPRHPRATEATP
ncbi:MAG: Nitrogen regulation protein NtrB [Rhodanobacteraceae bacterium]|jgi:two-component system nitrogen regulation sensor histidine kinase GlnL|nr:MAG: Nitrogen regulation protein NtrB [Rhodanobacteraceae bacterium]